MKIEKEIQLELKTINVKKIIACCNDCGKKKYKTIREVGAITLMNEICPLCHKRKLLVPANDWKYMIGETEEWD